MSSYSLLFQTTDTIAATSHLNSGETSLTVTNGNFGTPSGTQLYVVDYDIPGTAEIISASVSGTAFTGIVRGLTGGASSTTSHAAGAKIGSIFVPQHYQAALDGTGWASGAILLGSASITSNFTSTGTSVTDVTGLSVTVTVPASNRSVVVKAYTAGAFSNAAAGTAWDLYLREGATTLQGFQTIQSVQGGISTIVPAYLETAPFTPVAGTHTYKVSYDAGAAGTFTVKAAATQPAYIAVYLY